MESQGKTTSILLIITSAISAVLLISSFFFALTPEKFDFFDGEREITSHTFIVNIDEQGIMDIEEEIIYSLDDKNGVIRNYAYDDKEAQKIEIKQIIINDNKEATLTSHAYAGNRGVYTYDDTGKNQEVKIFEPTDGKLKVNIKYRAHGLITEYKDMQDLYWMFYDSRGETIAPLDMHITINFPKEIGKENMQLFGHGDLEGDLSIIDDKTIEIIIPKFNQNTFGEVRVLMPTKPLNNVIKKINTEKYQNALEYELAEAQKTDEQIAKNAKRAEFNQKLSLASTVIAIIATILTVIGSLILFRKIYKKFDKEKYDIKLDYFRETPTDYSPAAALLVAYPDTPDVDQVQLTATIFNLYIKKQINIRLLEKENNRKKGSEEIYITVLPQTDFKLFKNEQHVYDWLKTTFGENSEGVYEEFIGTTEMSEKTAKDFVRKYNKFKSITKREYTSKKYRKQMGKNQKMKMWNIWFALVIVLVVAINFIIQTMLVAILLAIVSGLMLIQVMALQGYKSTCYQYTEIGATEHARCLGLKNYLNDYSLLNEAPPKSVNMWEKYFVFGMALGVTEKALDALYRKLPVAESTGQKNIDTRTIYTMHRMNTYHQITQMNSKAISNAQTIATPPPSRTSGDSSYGGGGGFSGGGGFGGGGGGSSSF
jgi:Predicted membrane protein